MWLNKLRDQWLRDVGAADGDDQDQDDYFPPCVPVFRPRKHFRSISLTGFELSVKQVGPESECRSGVSLSTVSEDDPLAISTPHGCRASADELVEHLGSVLFSDVAGLDYSKRHNAPRDQVEEPPGVKSRLRAVLLGHYDAGGIVHSELFRRALSRQQSQKRLRTRGRIPAVGPRGRGTPCQEVIYEGAKDSPSQGRHNKVYTRVVPDWDLLSGVAVDVVWWNEGRNVDAQCDRGVRFMSFADCQEAHREAVTGSGGPGVRGWCSVPRGDISKEPLFSMGLNVDLFWSTALLFRFVGSSGVKYWDDQFRDLCENAQGGVAVDQVLKGR